MKKQIILTLAIALIGISVYGQKPVDTNPYSLEGGISLNTNTGQTFSAPVLKFRYFVNDNISARLGIQFNSAKFTEYVYGNNDDGFPVESKKGTLEDKMSDYQIGIGGAYHFGQNEKLSPYAAVDFLIVGAKNVTEWNATDQTASAFDENRKGTLTTNATGMGFFLGLGFDYYFGKNIFIGAEVGFAQVSQKDKGGTFSETVGQTTTTVDAFPDQDISLLGNASSGFIRLGWRF